MAALQRRRRAVGDADADPRCSSSASHSRSGGWPLPSYAAYAGGAAQSAHPARARSALSMLSLFHWAHRFRYTLYDGLQIKHLNEVVAVSATVLPSSDRWRPFT